MEKVKNLRDTNIKIKENVLKLVADLDKDIDFQVQIFDSNRIFFAQEILNNINPSTETATRFIELFKMDNTLTRHLTPGNSTDSIFKDSRIELKKEEIKFLKECFSKEFTTELIFRGSENEFNAKLFHQLCDDKGPTLAIIKSQKDLVFGGYSSISWKNKGGEWDRDDDSFIFSLTKKSKH